jgi:PIN domain nuclease of toxin-antitoxin system
MRYLLDTHTFIWVIQDLKQISEEAQKRLTEPDVKLYLSLASIWEISIKVSTGKLNLQEPLGEFLREQLVLNVIDVLPITFEHVTKVRELPFHHRDPFDRLIIAQSILENLPVIGKDEWFDRYGLTRYW